MLILLALSPPRFRTLQGNPPLRRIPFRRLPLLLRKKAPPLAIPLRGSLKLAFSSDFWSPARAQTRAQAQFGIIAPSRGQRLRPAGSTTLTSPTSSALAEGLTTLASLTLATTPASSTLVEGRITLASPDAAPTAAPVPATAPPADPAAPPAHAPLPPPSSRARCSTYHAYSRRCLG